MKAWYSILMGSGHSFVTDHLDHSVEEVEAIRKGLNSGYIYSAPGLTIQVRGVKMYLNSKCIESITLHTDQDRL